VTSLYEALGSSPDASHEQLQQAYRRAARRLHPDLNPSAEADESMRALNDAWEILGSPERRRRYDAEMRLDAARPIIERPPTVATRDVDDGFVEPRRGWRLRPSVVILGILAAIFVITAYAAPSKSQPRSTFTTVPTPTTASSLTGPNQGSQEAPLASGSGADSDLVGKCILPLPGYDAMVMCNQHGAKTIVAEVTSSSDCPQGTTVYQLEGHSQLVCLTSSGS